MKKLLAILVVLTLVTGVVFADVTVGGWGRGAFVPLKFVSAPQDDGKVVKGDDGKDLEGNVYAGSGITWWMGGPIHVGGGIHASSDLIGFDLGLGSDGARAIWATPFGSDLLKLTYHTYIEYDPLRGKLDGEAGGFESFVYSAVGKDAIFQRFGGGNGDGFILSSAPIDGLLIAFQVRNHLEDQFAANAYRNMQLAVGYQLEGIGHLRVQFIGGWFGTIDKKDKNTIKYASSSNEEKPSYDDFIDAFLSGDPDELDKLEAKTETDWSLNPARIELAFALTAVDNLLVDLGFKFYLPQELKDDVKKFGGIQITLGAQYRMDAFAIKAMVGTGGLGAYERAVKGTDDRVNGLELNINLVPTFDIEDIGTIGAMIGMGVKGNGKDVKGKEIEGQNSLNLGLGAFYQKGLGNGQFMVGLGYQFAPISGKDNKVNGSGVFSIPIIVEYWF